MRRRDRLAAIAWLVAGLLGAGSAHAQLPGGVQVPGGVGIPTPLPSKDQLLAQAQQMLSELTSLKANTGLPAAQVKKVDEPR
jgi:hypothetical protein